MYNAKHFDCAFISVNRLRRRKGPFAVGDWIMDSGAFTTIKTHGGYPEPVSEYAAQIKRWSGNGKLLAAVAQDYMCEAHMLERTGLTVADHQRLTIERYDDLLRCDVGGATIMPVLQGYQPQEYVAHIRQYGARLTPGMWVGVGSVCKRNGNVSAIEEVLTTIHRERPDLRLHGFGLKSTALRSGLVVDLLHSADSMAWSFAARKQGRNAHDWREAARFVKRIQDQPQQGAFLV
ncbi:MAG: hypothetical protein IPN24_11255 [Betaproteobacteria bacterium]|nr:hypothetical protein [Betaproteobacteria bacterium]